MRVHRERTRSCLEHTRFRREHTPFYPDRIRFPEDRACFWQERMRCWEKRTGFGDSLSTNMPALTGFGVFALLPIKNPNGGCYEMRSKQVRLSGLLRKNGGIGFWGGRARIFQVGSCGYETTSYDRHGRIAGTALPLHFR